MTASNAELKDVLKSLGADKSLPEFPPNREIREGDHARVGTNSAARFFWGVSMFAAILGGLYGVIGVTVIANGAPQEASAAAVACMVAIVPYCMARAVDELTRGRT
jgi:hypothetical protein